MERESTARFHAEIEESGGRLEFVLYRSFGDSTIIHYVTGFKLVSLVARGTTVYYTGLSYWIVQGNIVYLYERQGIF